MVLRSTKKGTRYGTRTSQQFHALQRSLVPQAWERPWKGTAERNAVASPFALEDCENTQGMTTGAFLRMTKRGADRKVRGYDLRVAAHHI